MFSNDQIVYLQMQKTACTHIANLLCKYVGGTLAEKHAQLKEPKSDKIVLGSIRNPWDWYVSLWAYGCSGQGFLFDGLTGASRNSQFFNSILKSRGNPRKSYRALRRWWRGAKKNHGLWRKLYSDSSDKDLFRKWLKFVLCEKGKNDLIEGYAESDIRRFAGFMTFRFHRLYLDYDCWQTHWKTIRNDEELNALYDRHGNVDAFIRMENLENDFAEIMAKLGIDLAVDDLLTEKKHNVSSHGEWRNYYDEETTELVRTQERFIVEKFGYEGPFG